MAGWAVVQAYAGQESRAERNLARQRFEYFSPKCEVWVGARKAIRQLFPSYLFVLVVDQWRAVLSTYGVVRVIMDTPTRPAILPRNTIDDIMARTDRDGVVRISRERFSPGQRVLITGGPFAGHEGIYEGQSGAERCRVMLSWLGRAAVRDDHLEAA